MLTARQQKVLDFIQTEQQAKGITPSTREIQDHFGFASQTSVMQYLVTLERKGVLQRQARKARSLFTGANRLKTVNIPILGQIPAGMATTTEEEADGHLAMDVVSVNASKNDRTFALRVRGDSMIDAHILDGDIVVLENREAKNGDIVAALIDGETTLKRYVVERGRLFLKAENPNYPDLVPVRELRVQGVMVSLVRKHAALPPASRGLEVNGH